MPTIAHAFLEEVMREIRSGIVAAATLPLDEPPLNAMLKEIKERVEFQLPDRDEELDRQKWDDQERNVMAAANAVGVIARCIARVQQTPYRQGRARQGVHDRAAGVQRRHRGAGVLLRQVLERF
jgi:hypothetical protein